MPEGGDIDLLELAEELARIAVMTTEPLIGRRLMAVVSRLLEEAGLPTHDTNPPAC
jgi:hypothetical protein